MKILGDNLAIVTLIFFFCIFICWIVLAKLRWGRNLYAIGGNEEAARLSGIPVTGTKLLAYGLSGFFCAVAGICQAAQEMQGDPESGMTYELTAIAIVVIGGHQSDGRKRRDRLDIYRRDDHRIPGKNAQHQRGRRSQPPHADGNHHRGRRPVPEIEKMRKMF